jgi:hypothetical protein
MIGVARTAQHGVSALFVFNTGDTPAERTYALEALDLPSPGFVHTWLINQTRPEPTTALPVRLAAHDGTLFLVSPRPWAEIPERLG